MITSPNLFSGVFDMVVTHAQALGIFEVVYPCEPKSAPPNGLSCAIYVGGPTQQGFSVVPARSGLDVVAKRCVFTVRIHYPMLHEPVGEIEPTVLGATELLIDSYIGDFELDGTAAFIDIFGMYGEGISGLPGYITIDNKIFRVMSVTLPVVLKAEVTESG